MNQKGKVNKKKKDPEPSIEDIYQNKHFALQKDKTLETIFEEPKVTRDGVEHFTSVKKYKRYLHFDDCPTAAKLRKRQERAKKVAAVSAHYQGRLTRSRLKEPSGASSVQDGNSCSSSSSYTDFDLQCLPEKNYHSGSGDWNLSFLPDSKCSNSELFVMGNCEENSSDEDVTVKNYTVITAEQPSSYEISDSGVITETNTEIISVNDQACPEPEMTSGISIDSTLASNNIDACINKEKNCSHVAAVIKTQISSEEKSILKEKHCLKNATEKSEESLVPLPNKDDNKEEICPQNASKENTEILISSQKCEAKLVEEDAQISHIFIQNLHQKDEDRVKQEHYLPTTAGAEQKIKKETSLYDTEGPEQHTSEIKSTVMNDEAYARNSSASVLEESIQQKQLHFTNILGESRKETSVVSCQNKEVCSLAKTSNISDLQDTFQNLKNVEPCESELISELKEIIEKKDTEKIKCKQHTEILKNELHVVNDSPKCTSEGKHTDDKDRQTL